MAWRWGPWARNWTSGHYRIARDGQIFLEARNRPTVAPVADETRLYVVDSVEFQAASTMSNRTAPCATSACSPTCGRGPNGGPDGVKCDTAGNFYLTGMKEDKNPPGRDR